MSEDEARRALDLALAPGVPVSRDAAAKLALYAARLREWQRAKNLVSPATLDTLWTRHMADSAQLLALAPHARRWLDLGSGAGFPGLVLAVLLAGLEDAQIHLVESNGRKCAFLRAVARETGAPAVIHDQRIESLPFDTIGPVDIVTARACAALPVLLRWAKPWLEAGARGLFPKGRGAAQELTGIAHSTRIATHPSRTDPDSVILEIQDETASRGAP